MKGPNKLLKKKYISSLVVAAFLILSVLTAYNIKIGKEGLESSNTTEVKETIGQDNVNNTDDERNGDVTNSRIENDSDYNGALQENETDETGSENRTERTTEEIEKEQDEKNETKDQETGYTSGSSKMTDYSYDGETKLTWPVLGNIILPYSMDTTVYYTTLDQYACNDGVLISARVGDEVVAAADGRVVNVSESDRYGKTMTVLIGDYYEVYYSQIDNLKYDIGDDIKEGAVIATVAESTRAFSLEGPHVFFKMTYKGEPVNPTDYLRN